MPKKYSIFRKMKMFLFGSFQEKNEDSEQFFEAFGGCSKCEIRDLFISQLKKKNKITRSIDEHMSHTDNHDAMSEEQKYLNAAQESLK